MHFSKKILLLGLFYLAVFLLLPINIVKAADGCHCDTYENDAVKSTDIVVAGVKQDNCSSYSGVQSEGLLHVNCKWGATNKASTAVTGATAGANEATAITTPAADPRCFTKNQCERLRMDDWGMSAEEATAGFYQGTDTADVCGNYKSDSGEDIGFCSAAGQATTEISFGGKKTFKHLGEFIQFIYRYAVWAAGILAVVVMMFAGFQWLTSGGNAEKITSARKKINGALMGLFLAVCSYLLLSQLSPYLVNLRLPQVWMVQSEALPSTFKVGQFCDTSDSDGSKTECEKNKGHVCLPVGFSEGGPCLTAAKVVVVTSAALAAAASGGLGIVAPNITADSVGSALTSVGGRLTRLAIPANLIWKGASAGKIAVNVVKVGGRLIRTGIKAGGIYVEEEFIGAGGKIINFGLDKIVGFLDTLWNGGHVGMCLTAAANLQKGEMCDPSYDAHVANNGGCAKGLKCVEAGGSAMIKCWAGGGFGFCGDGKKGAICRTDEDCVKDEQGKQLVCQSVVHIFGTSNDLDVKQCSDGSVGQVCKEQMDCGMGLICYHDTCMPKDSSKGIVGNRCPFNESCVEQHCVKIDDDCKSFRDIKRSENETIFFRGVCTSNFPITNLNEKFQTAENLNVFGLLAPVCKEKWGIFD